VLLQTFGVALVSASAFLYPQLKENLLAGVMERQAIAEERRTRAKKEQVELEMVEFEAAKKRSHSSV